jgi:outer membrane receptor protein involved in Fe transport
VLTDEYTLYWDQVSGGRGIYQSAFYRYLFDEKKHEFTSQFNYYNYRANNENDYAYDYFMINQNPVEMDLYKRYEDIENQRNMFELRNDYTRPLGNWMLKAGYWSYFQKYDNSFQSDSRNAYKFYYRELRQEAYLNGSTTFGDFNLSAGLRYAYSFSKIDRKSTNEYGEFLPQVNLQYSINDQSSVKLSARRQIDRPSMAQLNPFVTQTDSLSLSMGNSDLNPQIINRAELQYAINYKSNYVAPKLFLNYSQNGIQRNTFINENGISITQSQNIGEYYSYGLGLSASIGIARWLKLNGNGRLYRSGVNGPDNYSEELTTWATNGSIVVSPWKDKNIGFMLSAQYQSKRLQYKAKSQRGFLMFIGLEAEVTEQFSIGGYVTPVNFNFTYDATERYDTNYEYSTTNQVKAPFLFAIDLSYKFNWGQAPKKIQRSLDYEKDGEGGSL